MKTFAGALAALMGFGIVVGSVLAWHYFGLPASGTAGLGLAGLLLIAFGAGGIYEAN